MKVFVYGTLQSGFHNHRILQAAQGKFIGRGFITDKQIHFVNKGSFPAVVDGKDVIHGEVWDIPETKVDYYGRSVYPVEILDGLEGYNPNRPKESNMYDRRRTIASVGGIKMWVSYYHWNGIVKPELRIRSGNWAKEVKKYGVHRN